MCYNFFMVAIAILMYIATCKACLVKYSRSFLPTKIDSTAF